MTAEKFSQELNNFQLYTAETLLASQPTSQSVSFTATFFFLSICNNDLDSVLFLEFHNMSIFIVVCFVDWWCTEKDFRGKLPTGNSISFVSFFIIFFLRANKITSSSKLQLVDLLLYCNCLLHNSHYSHYAHCF